tara:strand:+ start:917 stop:2719 length:1803 start_codon:yes stop_codon:yes gene_type:complete
VIKKIKNFFSLIDYKDNLNVYLIFFLSFISLASLFKSGFFSDDAYQSQIHGLFIERGTNLFTHTYAEIKGWISQGRIFPLTNLSFTFFYFLYDNILIYKFINIATISLCLVFFYKFLYSYLKDSNLAFVTSLIALSSFQFRLWHDPIQGFHILLPLTTLFFLLSICYFQKYLEFEDQRDLKISFTFFVIMILHYEVTYSLIFIYPILYYSYKKNIFNIFSTLKNYIYFFGSLILLTIGIRINNFFSDKNVYSSLDLGNPLGTLKAFLIQYSSALPLSYVYRTKEKLIKNFTEIYDVIFLLFVFYLLFVFTKKIIKSNLNFDLKNLFLVSLIISGGPALISAVTGHKNELLAIGYGFGYLPVFIQYFGTSILFIIIFIILIKVIKVELFKRILCIIFSLGLTLTLYINILSNRYVVEEANKTYKYPRTLLESSLKKGLFDNLIDDTVIIRKMRYAHDWMWFHATYSNKVFDLCEPKSLFSVGNYCLSKKYYFKELFENKNLLDNKLLDVSEKNVYSYSYNFDLSGKDIGQVFLTKVEQIEFKTNDKISKMLIKELFVYQQKKDRIYRLYFEDGLDFIKIMNDDTKPPIAYLVHTDLTKYAY